MNNTFAIENATFQEMHRTPAELVMGSITFLVITVMTMVGNLLVILSVFTYRPLKKVQNYFIVSLASADFAVAVLVMPFHLVKFLMRGRWVFGLWLCQMWLTFDILCCTASILNLTAIALDRYWAIHNPIEYANKRTLNLVGGMICIVWVLSAVISIPPLIGWNDWSKDSLKYSCELTTHSLFVIYSASGSFFLPLLVMTVVYIKIYIAARERILKNREKSALGQLRLLKKSTKKNNKNLRQSTGDSTDAAKQKPPNGQNERSPLIKQNNAMSIQTEKENLSNDLKVHAPAQQTSSQAMKQREKISVSKEKKAAKTLAVIMGVFVLCWLPFFLMYVILPFCTSCYLHPKVAEAITWLGYINSAINPVIYTIFNLDFRRAFERLLCLKLKQLNMRS